MGGAKNWGLWGCPMLFTTGCPCTIRITESQHYLTLQLFGDHNPECHSRPKLTGHKSTPALGGHKSYCSSGCDSENVESGMSSIEFFPFSTPLLPPHRRADGDQSLIRRKASNVASNIMHASVMGSPYPCRLFPAENQYFSREQNPHRFTAPIRQFSFGRTYGTFLC